MKTEEINKLYNDGKISITEADKLRKRGEIEDNELRLKIRELRDGGYEINDIDSRSKKNNEISELYGKGGLSISDTIAYENNLLLERNRKNTSTITTILAVYAVITILGVMISLFGLAQI
jgi:hypothetical protein|tara:strand:- start:619 stop:978 length:360 start_codon:yes stop_codon:yes gene_type:complete